VRGDWNAILGLLEDLHRYRDREEPRGAPKSGSAPQDREVPYLGQDLPLNWPPALTAGERSIEDPGSKPVLPSHLNADPSQLNYYVIPEAGNVSASAPPPASGQQKCNQVNLKFGMTAADVSAFESQQVNPSGHHIPAHHYPKPDGSHNTTLLTEEFLLNQPPHTTTTTAATTTTEGKTAQVGSVSQDAAAEPLCSTDVRLAEAINSRRWGGDGDLYPGSHSQAPPPPVREECRSL
jgi:hypothetical protein